MNMLHITAEPAAISAAGISATGISVPGISAAGTFAPGIFAPADPGTRKAAPGTFRKFIKKVIPAANTCEDCEEYPQVMEDWCCRSDVKKTVRQQKKEVVKCFLFVLFLVSEIAAALTLYFGWVILSKWADETPPEAPAMVLDRGQEYYYSLAFEQLCGWESKTFPEKLIAAQTVADAESVYLGLSRPMTVQTEPMSGKDGYYITSGNKVYLKASVLAGDDEKYMLFVLLHELFHAYEHELTVAVRDSLSEEARNLLAFRRAGDYAREFADYIPPAADYEKYRHQYVESDCNRYAAARREFYLHPEVAEAGRW